MQFNTPFIRLAAFAFFLLSFAMLVHAAPAPVSDGLLVRDGDGTPQCKDILTKAAVVLQVKVDDCGEFQVLKFKCTHTPGCDVKGAIAVIVAMFADVIVKIKAIIALGLTIDITVCIDLFIKLLVILCIGLKGCVGLTVELCLALVAVIKLYIELILSLCLTVVIKLAIILKIKLALTVYVNLLLTLGFKVVLVILGLVAA
ncbi:transmembrane protein [Ceratobasidium sp. AG-Ba]|nr:transmembrane protein [Ceratobasidium sp. AG-Ba]QRW02632.1 transmembrane protein [Ceratobasidium sp. AG-Ba]